jgi:amino acid transporter
MVCSAAAAAFVIAHYWKPEAIEVAVLVSTLTALVWYVLAMLCLFALRRREPGMFAKYRTPVYRVMPILVIVLSLFCASFYLGIENSDNVLKVTAVLYAAGLGYYFFWARRRLQLAAPEELAARQAELALKKEELT